MTRTYAEHTLDDAAFDTGSVRLTKGDLDVLGMPAHSGPLAVQHEGAEIFVEWQAGERTLRGEGLAEVIELHGRVGGLIRFHAVDDSIVVRVLDRPVLTARAQVIERVRPATPPPDAARSQRSRRGSRADRLRQERLRVRSRKEFDWDGPVGFHRPSLDALRKSIESHGWDTEEAFALRLEGERLGAVSSFDELLALDLASVDHMPHQEATALKVLAQMDGRAVLADEVGLGKTIEAGLIMKELIVRGLARRILVVCPATLRDQWRSELSEKFGEDFEVVAKGTDPMDGDRLVMSSALAIRNVERLAESKWDLVIVDEAHRFAGKGAKASRRLLQEITTRYLLFLTATPVQNDLLELYRLVDALRPGTFASATDFKQQFMGADPREPRDPKALRELVSNVMVRTTREQAGIDKIARLPVDHPITLSKTERQAYDLCTKVLRTLMTSPHDGFRRRFLAHRLTASPRALGRTARKMAESHEDPRVREVLEELADLCLDFGLTSRQERLLEVVKRWVADRGKGRVLVFTQHTDTLEDLMRILDQEGVSAAAFHGGMSPAAKQRSIERFRAPASRRSSASVLVSTDSGAEGLNLQFANCVINYDLPWNPMRIEQRIGRVHRVTQTRDVHVANFYAEDTIDESVYRLLHDKLRMFELLFGQVTTILGELDDDARSSSFESRILDAYLSRDDGQMSAKLDSLGKKVDRAYDSAREMVQEGRHLDGWLVDRSHRSEITPGGARELVPQEVHKRDVLRRESIEGFVRRYLDQVDATITHDVPGTGERPGFVSATLPADIQGLLGGRTELHLAFGGDAMEVHGAAELCAVGTEVFEEILASMAEAGDLTAMVVDEARLEPDRAWFAAAPDAKFLNRTAKPSSAWETQAVWRVQSDGDRSGDQILVTGADALATSVAHRPLGAGEVVPHPHLEELVEDARRSARPSLLSLAKAAHEDLARTQEAERDRLSEYYDSQIEEAEISLDRAYNRERRQELEGLLGRLTRARQAAMGSAVVEAEVRADLLALRTVGSSLVQVTETWLDADGEFTLSFEHDLAGVPPASWPGDDGSPVTTVARCAGAHIVDLGRRRLCAGCETHRCASCDGGVDFAACPACGSDRCSVCLAEDLCMGCVEPGEFVALDELGDSMWELGGGATLWLGPHTAVIERADGERIEVVSEAGHFARSLPGYTRLVDALGSEVGVVTGVRVEPPPPADGVQISRESVLQWRVDPAGGRAIDLATARRLPGPRAPVGGEVPDDPLRQWVEGLREIVAGEVPAVVADEVCRVRVLRGAADGAEVVDRTHDWDGSTWEVVRPLRCTTTGDRLSLSGAGIELTVSRANRSFLVEGLGPPAVISGQEGIDSGLEVALGRVAARHGRPGAEIGLARPTVPPALEGGGDGVTLRSRSVTSVWRLDEGAIVDPLKRADLERADADQSLPDVDRWPSFDALVTMADRRLDRPPPLCFTEHHEVDEVWAGFFGEAHAVRVVSPGADPRPVLDDNGSPASTFAVDSLGHLHEVGRSWHCDACKRERCRACEAGGQLGQCPVCTQSACGDCRQEVSGGEVVDRCQRCLASGCTGCGRSLPLVACQLCDRDCCASCTSRLVCRTCDSLAEMSQDEVNELPEVLVARGLAVSCADDPGGRVVVLVGPHRLELVVLVGGEVQTWVTEGGDPEPLALALGFGRVLGGIGTLAVAVAAPEPLDVGEPHLTFLEDRRAFVDVELLHDGPEAEGRGAVITALRIGLDEAQERAEMMRTVGSEVLAGPPTMPEVASSRVKERLRSSAAEVSPPATHRLLLTVGEEVTRESLTTEGIRRDAGSAHEPESRVARWSPPADHDPRLQGWLGVWAEAGWVARWCRSTSGSTSVELLTLGPFRLLALDDGTTSRVVRLDDQGHFPELAGVAHAVGSGADRIGVARYAGPDDEPRFRVGNDVCVKRRIKAEVRDSAADADPVATARACDRWGSSVPDISVEPRSVLDEELADALSVSLDEASGAVDRVVEVGYRAHGTWTTRYGNLECPELRLPSMAHPTTNDAKGSPVGPVVQVDRSGHFSVAVGVCLYCVTQVCPDCDDGLAPCGLCTQPICLRCSPVAISDPPGRLCPACADLTKVSVLGRRRLPGRPKAALQGTDGVHTVTVVPDRSGSVTVSDERIGQDSALRTVTPGPALAARMQQASGDVAFLGAHLPQ